MRIEQPSYPRGPWRVFAEPGEFYGNTADVLLGTVTPRGALNVTPYRFRGEPHVSARLRLGDARHELMRGGHIRDRALERSMGVEASSGSFIIELDNGEVRRFNTLKPEIGQPKDRPSARHWAEEALQSGRATHADLFRHSSSVDPKRDRVFSPHVLPERDGHPRLVVGQYEQLPLDSWSMRDGSGFLRRTSPDVERAYTVKKHAMDLVTDRYLRITDPQLERQLLGLPRPYEPVPSPVEIADAWEVAIDAFEEARLPLQAHFARNNVDYWRDARAQRDVRRRRRR